MAKAKYRTPEHRALEQRFAAQIAAGQGHCTEPICLMDSRHIPPSTPRTGWHIPHMEDGIGYRNGPAHARCNDADGGRRRHKRKRTPRKWIL